MATGRSTRTNHRSLGSPCLRGSPKTPTSPKSPLRSTSTTWRRTGSTARRLRDLRPRVGTPRKAGSRSPPFSIRIGTTCRSDASAAAGRPWPCGLGWNGSPCCSPSSLTATRFGCSTSSTSARRSSLNALEASKNLLNKARGGAAGEGRRWWSVASYPFTSHGQSGGEAIRDEGNEARKPARALAMGPRPFFPAGRGGETQETQIDVTIRAITRHASAWRWLSAILHVTYRPLPARVLAAQARSCRKETEGRPDLPTNKYIACSLKMLESLGKDGLCPSFVSC